MIICIDAGHNNSRGGDSGAVGFLKEDSVVLEVSKRLSQKLRNKGITVIETYKVDTSTLIESLQYRCTLSNVNKADYFISIHANMGEDSGTEVWYKSDKGKVLATPILDEIIKATGYKNRGLKLCGVDGKNLYVISNTSAPACLVELFFLNNEADCNKYNADILSDAILKGILRLTGTNSTTNNESINFIKGAQLSLNILIKSSLVIDGIIGQNTINAIKKFQFITGLKVDGTLNKDTLSAMDTIIKRPLLKVGSNNVVVRYLQYMLCIDTDGIFGVQTESAVIKFQKLMQIEADGVVGAQTWSKLLKS